MRQSCCIITIVVVAYLINLIIITVLLNNTHTRHYNDKDEACALLVASQRSAVLFGSIRFYSVLINQ